MLLGPVFHAELVTTSRRRRYYAARLVYGLTLLLLVGWTYEAASRDRSSVGPAGAPGFAFLADMASQIFATFLLAQVGAVLCLTPAMVAGTIADERQRKTLHDVLASRLSSFEIVVGKLAARMLQLVVLVLTGLPIMAMLSLFGGLDPPLILAAFAGTLTTAFAVAGLAIFVSTQMRRARDAILVTYLLELICLGAMPLLRAFFDPSSVVATRWVSRIARGLEQLDPFQLAHLTNPSRGLAILLARMALFQISFGLVFVGLAVLRLRPASADIDSGRSAETWARPSTGHARTSSPRWIARILGRPPVSDDPMAWKERHVARLGPALRSVGLLATIFSAVFLGESLLDLGRPALAEVAKYGYGDAPAGVVHKVRDELNATIAPAGAVAAMVWIVGLAGTTAAGIPSEREDDTWISLLATPLSGVDVLRGKALGALHRWRVPGLVALFLWTFGLVAGAIHPLGYALTLALFATYTAFALALGSFLSLHMRSTTRAIVATVAVLFVLNGGYLLCLLPVAGRIDDLWLSAPVMAYILDVAPERYAPVQALFGTIVDTINLRVDPIAHRLLACLVSVVGYGIAAIVLAIAAIDGFDRVADRPRRPPGFSTELAEALAGRRDEPEAVEVAPET